VDAITTSITIRANQRRNAARLSDLLANIYNKIEELSEEVYLAWMEEKLKQGFHAPVDCPKYPAPAIGRDEAQEYAFTKHCPRCHPDMYPYKDLSENIKEYDRVTVRTVLDAIAKIG